VALSNYTELQAAVADWLHRTDLTSQIQDFITMAESRINRKLRLRVMESDETLSTSIGSRFAAIPNNFVEPIDCQILLPNSTSWQQLHRKLPYEFTVTTTNGTPTYWAVDGTNIAFERPLDVAYNIKLRIIKAFDIATDSTNWLLTNHPDIYLYGALLEAPVHLRDEKRLLVWQERFDRAYQEVAEKEKRSRKRPLNTEPGLYYGGRQTYERWY
jgi:hypothetical protein